MLSAQHLQVNGRRNDLLPPTSLEVLPGELLLVEGDGQDQRTALALTLSGRMRPSGGVLSWDGNPKIKRLRLASSLVDSPGVNEPEQHLSVGDLVTEDLALVPRRYRGALLSKPWLKVNRFEDIADLWTEEIPARRRVELLTALALANPRTDLLVIDSPDRHSADSGDWLPRLQELAYDGGRPLAVVATVAALPVGWTGPFAAIGNAVEAAPAAAPAAVAPADADTSGTSGTSDTRRMDIPPGKHRDHPSILLETEDSQ
ncbi:MAG: ABC transporter ATP-binding protein [Arthrobacter sp.]